MAAPGYIRLRVQSTVDGIKSKQLHIEYRSRSSPAQRRWPQLSEYTPVKLKGETTLVPAPPRRDWQVLWRWSGAATTFVWHGTVCTGVECSTDRKTHGAENTRTRGLPRPLITPFLSVFGCDSRALKGANS